MSYLKTIVNHVRVCDHGCCDHLKGKCYWADDMNMKSKTKYQEDYPDDFTVEKYNYLNIVPYHVRYNLPKSTFQKSIITYYNCTN